MLWQYDCRFRCRWVLLVISCSEIAPKPLRRGCRARVEPYCRIQIVGPLESQVAIPSSPGPTCCPASHRRCWQGVQTWSEGIRPSVQIGSPHSVALNGSTDLLGMPRGTIASLVATWSVRDARRSGSLTWSDRHAEANSSFVRGSNRGLGGGCGGKAL